MKRKLLFIMLVLTLLTSCETLKRVSVPLDDYPTLPEMTGDVTEDCLSYEIYGITMQAYYEYARYTHGDITQKEYTKNVTPLIEAIKELGGEVDSIIKDSVLK